LQLGQAYYQLSVASIASAVSEVAVLHRRYAGVFASIVSACSAHDLKSGTVKTETDREPWFLLKTWCSIQHHSEAPASPAQRGSYRSTSASTVRRQLAVPDAALAAC